MVLQTYFHTFFLDLNLSPFPAVESSPSFLDNIVIPDYVHTKQNFTLNKKKYVDISRVSVRMPYNVNSSVAELLDIPTSQLEELELCWIQETEDEVRALVNDLFFFDDDALTPRTRRNT
jgi:hypothetical protein